MSRLDFKLEAVAEGSRARATTFKTLHGVVQTPIFMPVGTQATVKSQTIDSLKTVGSNVLLANTYHLMLRPGAEVFKKLGGIHKFMNWDKPVLTDSGGFQIFSLPHSREMNEDGARFQSYVDGQMVMLSPETSIQTQRAIGSDIMMVLDQCIPSTAEHEEAKAAMELTHRWAKRSLLARGDSQQSIFGIVQGACFEDLRKQSADFLATLPFDGFAIGGLAVGEGKSEREDFTELTASFLPQNLPRYLMGVGTPLDILEAVHRGVDMFDCIMPSALAQRGVAFTSQGKLQLRRSVYKFSEEKLDPDCACSACTNYSKAYLHHLVKTDEVLGWHLIAVHNLTFYHQMMREIRAAILSGHFLKYYQQKRIALALTDNQFPSTKPKLPKRSKAEQKKRLGDYEVHLSEKGFSSIKQISSGEVMHSVNPPDTEAYELYVEPSKIKERLENLKGNHESNLIIWDVGLGAAHNAMALINEVTKNTESTATVANESGKMETILSRVTLISFENDLDSLKLALKNPGLFPHLQHAAPHALLKNGEWKNKDGTFTWKLIKGNFLDHLHEAPSPQIIYYDLFSINSNSAHWTREAFRKIHSHCKKTPVKLITYSSATQARAAMLCEGFFVGAGPKTGHKPETTVAFNSEPEAIASNNLLGKEWLGRWSRSQSRQPELDQTLINHPQFNL